MLAISAEKLRSPDNQSCKKEHYKGKADSIPWVSLRMLDLGAPCAHTTLRLLAGALAGLCYVIMFGKSFNLAPVPG